TRRMIAIRLKEMAEMLHPSPCWVDASVARPSAAIARPKRGLVGGSAARVAGAAAASRDRVSNQSAPPATKINAPIQKRTCSMVESLVTEVRPAPQHQWRLPCIRVRGAVHPDICDADLSLDSTLVAGDRACGHRRALSRARHP